MEAEIVELCDFLDQPGMPGLKGKLIDDEGFPRADIDLHQVSSMRGRIACLNTDLSAAMRQIEVGLAELHALLKEEIPPTFEGQQATSQASNEETKTTRAQAQRQPT